ncbi:MAG TPA: glycosyltransferase, partial [Opitutus sp.]|nr:glycosyltransferase [Opitutus sp.]
LFLEPGKEVLVAHDGADVARHVETLTPERAAAIGQAARARVLAEHTYAHRVTQLEAVLEGADTPNASTGGPADDEPVAPGFSSQLT